MSESVMTEAARTEAAADPAPWRFRMRQVGAILRLELKKSFLGRRALGLYLLALAPVAILVLRAIADAEDDPSDIGEATMIFAGPIYQGFMLRFIILLGCVWIFGNLIRREVQDRSLHYYFLAPLRREVLVGAKYLTGLIASVVLFGLSTVACFLLSYVPYDDAGVERFFTQGPGFAHLGAYLLVTVLACIGYGAVFLAFGFFFKSPAVPAIVMFGWEWFHFLLPPLLKKTSVVHYLQSLCPVPVSQGPLALLADAPSPWVAIPGLLLFTVALLAISAWRIRRMEVRYEEE